MASLFESLAVTGSRTASGAANATGRVWFYRGTGSTLATIYADADEESTVSNPVTLNGGGKATVYFTGKVRARIEDSTGLELAELTLTERAERIEVKNAGFTGLLASGSQGAGGVTDLNTVLTSLFVSLGGLDGKYKEFTGATARSYQSVIRGIQVSVKDYGAVGNGVNDDTVAIQAAANEALRLGGSVLYFDPGTYLTSAAITITSSNLIVRGAGTGAVNIKASNGTQNAFTCSASTVTFEHLNITHAASTTGTAISAAGCQLVLNRVFVDGGSVNGTYLIGVDVTGAGITKAVNCNIITVAGNAAARALRLGGTATTLVCNVVLGCVLKAGSNGKCIELTGAGTDYTIVGNHFSVSTSTGVYFNAAYTGTGVAIVDNPTLGELGSTAIDITAITTDPKLVQRGNGVDGYAEDVASGGTVTPSRGRGAFIRYRGTSTGSAYIVAAPLPAPNVVTNGQRAAELTIQFYNNAAGAVTGWTLNAVYHVSAAISTVDGNKTTVRFLWDHDATVWREITRAVTT